MKKTIKKVVLTSLTNVPVQAIAMRARIRLSCIKTNHPNFWSE